MPQNPRFSTFARLVVAVVFFTIAGSMWLYWPERFIINKTVVYYTQVEPLPSSVVVGNTSHHLLDSFPYTPRQEDYFCNPSGEWNLSVWDGVRIGKNLDSPPQLSSHKAVAASILRGLEKQNIVSWNVNPITIDTVNEVVWLVNCWASKLESSVNWMKASCSQAKNCRTKIIICGPIGLNGDYFPGMESVEFLLAPGPWVAQTFRAKFPGIVDIKILVSGVDEAYWKPSKPKDPKKAFIFYKRNAGTRAEKEPVAIKTVKQLESRGFSIESVIYGKYDHDEYRKKLDGASFALFFHGTESQGISLAEAWAMDVPTFVYLPQIFPMSWADKRWISANSAPYLNEQTGFFWNSIENLMLFIEKPDGVFTPRHYVLRTMTDKIAQFNTLRAIECSWQRLKLKNETNKS